MQDETISGLGAANLPLTGTELMVIVQDGVTKKTALDNLPEQLNSNEIDAVQNANAPTSVNPFATIGDLPLSGTYTPEFRGATGITSLTLVEDGTYFRIGNLVQGSFRFQGAITDSVAANFLFTLPIEPATFADNKSLTSTFGIYCQFADVQDFEVISLTGDVVAEVNINTLATITFDAVVTFNYLVA